MARPREKNPTPAELEVLRVIWESGPCTVRDALTMLNKQRPRAYTSVMSLMNVMTKKGLLSQKARGRAFVYSARLSQEKTRSSMLKDLLMRGFDGSASVLVSHLLEQSEPTADELDEIRRTIAEFSRQKGGA